MDNVAQVAGKRPAKRSCPRRACAGMQPGPSPARLSKAGGNPILTPLPEHAWESRQTFNAAALLLEDRVHLLYRAIGEDWVSRLGYAASGDGVNIAARLPDPVYTCGPFRDEEAQPLRSAMPCFSSGGHHAGCEDPRLTAIEGRVYMFFVAFDGYSIPRLALTSIRQEDFLARRWEWAPARIVSRPGLIDKSGCLLPERVKGKYVIFHRVFPDILIDYRDSLEFAPGEYLASKDAIRIRPAAWDSRKIGAGPPPLKTEAGWLLIYYAVDERDCHRYKLGAMLLDLENPARVRHRTHAPILEPSAEYENLGHKAGIAYPCGAAVLGERLYVYYGGADSVVCVATASLPELLAALRREPAE